MLASKNNQLSESTQFPLSNVGMMCFQIKLIMLEYIGVGWDRYVIWHKLEIAKILLHILNIIMSCTLSSWLKRSNRKIDILLTDIEIPSTCLEVDLPKVLYCDNCKFKHSCNTDHLTNCLRRGVRFRKSSFDDNAINLGHL